MLCVFHRHNEDSFLNVISHISINILQLCITLYYFFRSPAENESDVDWEADRQTRGRQTAKTAPHYCWFFKEKTPRNATSSPSEGAGSPIDSSGCSCGSRWSSGRGKGKLPARALCSPDTHRLKLTNPT